MLIYLLNTSTTGHLFKSSGSAFKKQSKGRTLWHSKTGVCKSFVEDTVDKKVHLSELRRTARVMKDNCWTESQALRWTNCTAEHWGTI